MRLHCFIEICFVAIIAKCFLIRVYKNWKFLGTWLMSGDNLYGTQPLKFYAQKMTDTKKIALLINFEKKLFPESNSKIYIHRKNQEIKVPDAA